MHPGQYPECVLFVFWEKLQLDNFVARSTDLHQQKSSLKKSSQIISKVFLEDILLLARSTNVGGKALFVKSLFPNFGTNNFFNLANLEFYHPICKYLFQIDRKVNKHKTFCTCQKIGNKIRNSKFGNNDFANSAFTPTFVHLGNNIISSLKITWMEEVEITFSVNGIL